MAASDCTICSDPLAAGLTVTRCGHVFHTHCIFQWFEHKPLCPLCKTERKGDAFERTLLEGDSRLCPGVEEEVEARVARGEEPPDSKQASAVILCTMRDAADLQKQVRTSERAKARASEALVEVRVEARRLEGRLQSKSQEASAKERKLKAVSSSAASAGMESVVAAATAAVSGAALPSLGEEMSREKLASLGQQVGWRSSELRQLRAKVNAVRADVADLQAEGAARRVRRGGEMSAEPKKAMRR